MIFIESKLSLSDFESLKKGEYDFKIIYDQIMEISRVALDICVKNNTE